MKTVPLIKSRNFDTHAVARKTTAKDDIELILVGYAMGYVQVIRDGCSKKYGPKFKGLIITSSNRGDYNDDVPNAAENSHHIWRIDKDGKLHVALDLKPLGISLQELYNWCIANCRGEIYLNKAQGIVHVALVPQEDQHWIQ